MEKRQELDKTFSIENKVNDKNQAISSSLALRVSNPHRDIPPEDKKGKLNQTNQESINH